jgi:hypothetical protein
MGYAAPTVLVRVVEGVIAVHEFCGSPLADHVKIGLREMVGKGVAKLVGAAMHCCFR